MQPRSRYTPLLIVLVAVFGCGEADSPAALAGGSESGPRFTFTNGPSTPNVFRGEGGIVMTFFDPESGLDVWIGLPADLSDSFLCGGSSFDIGAVSQQSAGQLQEAFNVLLLGRDMDVRVYDLGGAGFTDICADTPIAHGIGNLTSNDNDFLVSGPGAGSFNLRVQGTLDDLVNGGKIRLTGAFHYVFLPDGSFRVLRQSVDLHRVGGK